MILLSASVGVTQELVNLIWPASDFGHYAESSAGSILVPYETPRQAQGAHSVEPARQVGPHRGWPLACLHSLGLSPNTKASVGRCAIRYTIRGRRTWQRAHCLWPRLAAGSCYCVSAGTSAKSHSPLSLRLCVCVSPDSKLFRAHRDLPLQRQSRGVVPLGGMDIPGLGSQAIDSGEDDSTDPPLNPPATSVGSSGDTAGGRGTRAQPGSTQAVARPCFDSGSGSSTLAPLGAMNGIAVRPWRGEGLRCQLCELLHSFLGGEVATLSGRDEVVAAQKWSLWGRACSLAIERSATSEAIKRRSMVLELLESPGASAPSALSRVESQPSFVVVTPGPVGVAHDPAFVAPRKTRWPPTGRGTSANSAIAARRRS